MTKTHQMKPRRVAVTGIGIVAPGSIGKDAFWQNCCEGKVFTGEITAFDTKGLRCPIAAEIKDTPEFETLAARIRAASQQEISSRTILLALMGAELALSDSNLSGNDLTEGAIHIVAGTTMGIEDSLLKKEAPESLAAPTKELLDRFSPCEITKAICNYFQFTNPTQRMFMNACAAGNYAIGDAFSEIGAGRVDVALAGGVDALSYLAVTGFNRLLSVTPDVCRPFDKNRRGMAVGEGAAFLVLEEYERALARGAKIYAELRGYGLGVDAFHITSPSPDGRGIVQAMVRALKRSSLIGDEIDYVSAHGTGTAANDAAESAALLGVFGDQLPPMSSIKSMIGHTMGAASAIEAAACCLMLDHQEILPTANFETPDEKCPIDCVPNRSRKAKLTHVMSNALAFGGNNSSVIFSVPTEERVLDASRVSKPLPRIAFTHTFACDDLDAYYAEHLPLIDTRMVDRQSLLFTAAIADAAAANGVDLAALPSTKTAIISGSKHAALVPSIDFLNTAIAKGALGVSPMTFPNTVGNAPASRASIWLGFRGNVLCVSDGPFLSGLNALQTGFAEVQNDCDYAFVGLSDDDTVVISLICSA